ARPCARPSDRPPRGGLRSRRSAARRPRRVGRARRGRGRALHGTGARRAAARARARGARGLGGGQRRDDGRAAGSGRRTARTAARERRAAGGAAAHRRQGDALRRGRPGHGLPLDPRARSVRALAARPRAGAATALRQSQRRRRGPGDGRRRRELHGLDRPARGDARLPVRRRPVAARASRRPARAVPRHRRRAHPPWVRGRAAQPSRSGPPRRGLPRRRAGRPRPDTRAARDHGPGTGRDGRGRGLLRARHGRARGRGGAELHGAARGDGAPARQSLGARADPLAPAGTRPEDAPVRARPALLRGGRAPQWDACAQPRVECSRRAADARRARGSGGLAGASRARAGPPRL
ncbi:MAG: hypothetical protein AVDCRST_MAG45-1087, partial [uncultured Solirubrobacterales bacterium]